jgi:Subtilase family
MRTRSASLGCNGGKICQPASWIAVSTKSSFVLEGSMTSSTRILIKMRPQTALRAVAASQTNLRPLYDLAPTTIGFALQAEPQWFLADLPDGGPNAWDVVYTQVAGQLGVAESDVIAAEPDLAQSYPDSNEIARAGQAFAAAADCTAKAQATTGPRPTGPAFGWHLQDVYSQLGSARDAVVFSEPRTRIAHIDTGYDKTQKSKPENILVNLERNFVDGDGNPNSSQDSNVGGLFDNSGHGTGTIGILAGCQVQQLGGQYLGGCAHAEILPLRIANSVVMFFTSNFAKAIQYAIQQHCDVVSISMGGLPSSAWNDAVNAAYEAGICIVAASGDCFGGLPSHHVVYPARYHRTIAACGVMEDGSPYYNLPANIIEGSWGPDSCMTAALASYTPNIPWARITCPDAIDMDGQGTSASTPQIAAAVALWIEKYKNILPCDWRRVEGVRNALFRSAKKTDPTHFGQGILQARAALDIAPVLNLPITPPDSDSFSFFRVITGLGVSDVSGREMMFNLELTQRYLRNVDMQKIIPDPAADVPMNAVKTFMDAAIADTQASAALRKHIAERYCQVFGGVIPGAPPDVVAPVRAACGSRVSIPEPPFRRLRVYGLDPSFSTRLDTADINEVTAHVRWERDLKPGPVGEYLQVEDVDAAGVKYRGVDLNDPRVLAQNGWAPAEGNPEFHQQSVYAVAMTTIANFEHALGRPVLWRPEANPENEFDDSKYRQRLLISPHALRQTNAFYSPDKIALLFGYFQASASDPGDHVPGSTVYACLSHDIVAHETTHAILDGMHRRFLTPSNRDVLALHEGFADIVALLQHFTMPEVLEQQLRQTRGNIESENILGSLAVQFGRAVGGRGALRSAIGEFDENGLWRRIVPNPADYRSQNIQEPHARGAILVAGVFDAFLAIYNRRTADLLRIYTRGTGVLPSGAIHPDLVHRLAAEAAKSASHVLNMCIRALDYVPPVDITFGEYLRAIITADFDLVDDDDLNYRVAFVDAFRKRGIYPDDLETLSVDTLRWEGLKLDSAPPAYKKITKHLKRFADQCFYISSREDLFQISRMQRRGLHEMLEKIFVTSPEFATELGLDPKLSFEVHELRRALRTGPDGNTIPQIIAALTQSKTIDLNGPHTFFGGSTIIVDLSEPAIKYRIMKRVNSANREARTSAFLRDMKQDPLRALLVTPDQREPFALLHSLTGVSGF